MSRGSGCLSWLILSESSCRWKQEWNAFETFGKSWSFTPNRFSGFLVLFSTLVVQLQIQLELNFCLLCSNQAQRSLVSFKSFPKALFNDFICMLFLTEIFCPHVDQRLHKRRINHFYKVKLDCFLHVLFTCNFTFTHLVHLY